ncbi:MAG TPA: response regulator [Gaiellaceae bacterium]|nr:response regulator [Gaiellaceae bacterium]
MSRVLVVDDEQLVRDLTVQVLLRGGHDVVSSATAQGALDLLEQERFDLVVTDVVMPGLSGVELLNEIRDRQPDLPVLLMTGGSPDPDRTARALDLGATAMIYKPFAHTDLLEAVAAAVAGREER